MSLDLDDLIANSGLTEEQLLLKLQAKLQGKQHDSQSVDEKGPPPSSAPCSPTQFVQPELPGTPPKKQKRYHSPGQRTSDGGFGKAPEKKHKENDFDTDFESDIELDLDSDLETDTNSVQGSQSLSTRKDKHGKGTHTRNAPTKRSNTTIKHTDYEALDNHKQANPNAVVKPTRNYVYPDRPISQKPSISFSERMAMSKNFAQNESKILEERAKYVKTSFNFNPKKKKQASNTIDTSDDSSNTKPADNASADTRSPVESFKKQVDSPERDKKTLPNPIPTGILSNVRDKTHGTAVPDKLTLDQRDPKDASTRIDPFGGFRIANKPYIDFQEFYDSLADLPGCRLYNLKRMFSTVVSPLYLPPNEINWVLFGVIAHKSEVKFLKKKAVDVYKYGQDAPGKEDGGKKQKQEKPQETETDRKFMMMQVTDLESLDVPLALHGEAFEKYWRLQEGVIVAILNPSTYTKKSNEGTTFGLSLGDRCGDCVIEIGYAKDYGQCSGTVLSTGSRCRQWVNKSQNVYCMFHNEQNIKSARGKRMEMNAPGHGGPNTSYMTMAISKKKRTGGHDPGFSVQKKEGLLPASNMSYANGTTVYVSNLGTPQLFASSLGSGGSGGIHKRRPASQTQMLAKHYSRDAELDRQLGVAIRKAAPLKSFDDSYANAMPLELEIGYKAHEAVERQNAAMEKDTEIRKEFENRDDFGGELLRAIKRKKTESKPSELANEKIGDTQSNNRIDLANGALTKEAQARAFLPEHIRKIGFDPTSSSFNGFGIGSMGEVGKEYGCSSLRDVVQDLQKRSLGKTDKHKPVNLSMNARKKSAFVNSLTRADLCKKLPGPHTMSVMADESGKTGASVKGGTLSKSAPRGWGGAFVPGQVTRPDKTQARRKAAGKNNAKSGTKQNGVQEVRLLGKASRGSASGIIPDYNVATARAAFEAKFQAAEKKRLELKSQASKVPDPLPAISLSSLSETSPVRPKVTTTRNPVEVSKGSGLDETRPEIQNSSLQAGNDNEVDKVQSLKRDQHGISKTLKAQNKPIIDLSVLAGIDTEADFDLEIEL